MGQRHSQRGRRWPKRQRAEAIRGLAISDLKLDRGVLIDASRQRADTKWEAPYVSCQRNRVTLRCLMFLITPGQMWQRHDNWLTRGTASLGPFIEGHAEVAKRRWSRSARSFHWRLVLVSLTSDLRWSGPPLASCS